jgi:tetratricopeptide (TPR) repeat protein
MAGQAQYFISYTNRDPKGVEWARWLDHVLRAELQVETYMQYYDSKAGEFFREEIENRLAEGYIVLAIVTPSYEDSEICRWEVETAKRFIPVRCEAVMPRSWLNRIVYIDLYGKEQQDAVQLLKDKLKGLVRPSDAPQFPGQVQKPIGERPTYPGAVHNLPERNPLFTGREKELREVEAAFETHKTVALFAPGGFGKTQIALEYAHRHWDAYAVIWRFNAATEALLQEAFCDFARRVLGMRREETEDWQAVRDAITAWWQGRQDYLFLYESAEGCPALRDALPTGTPRGRALLTTREAVGLAIGKTVAVGAFSDEDALAFLRMRLGEAAEKDGAALAEAVGFLPLALAQAAGYIAENQCSVAECMAFLRHPDLVLFEEPLQDALYDKTVLTTWQDTLDQLEPDAAALINLLAYCAPDDIPLQLFINGRNYLPDLLKETLLPENKWAQNLLIKKLIRCGLVTRGSDAQNRPLLSMPVLLQRVLRRQQGADAGMLRQCLSVVCSAFVQEDNAEEARIVYAHTWPHAVEVAAQAEMQWKEEKVIQAMVAAISDKTGYVLEKQGDYEAALQWYKKALLINEKVLGMEHPDIATTNDDIARVYYAQGYYPDALAWYHQALNIREKVFGEAPPHTTITYTKIAGVYEARGEYDMALAWYDKALVIYEKVFGDEHYATATTFTSMKAIYYAQGHCGKALAWYQRALVINEKMLSEEHLDTAQTHDSIAEVYNAQGDYGKAFSCSQEALATYNKGYDEEHLDKTVTYIKLASAYFAEDKDECNEAIRLYQKALAIFEKVLGEEHPHTVLTYNSIAQVYITANKPADAAPLFKKTFFICLQKLGKKHPYTKSVLESARDAHAAAKIPTPFPEWLIQ